MVQMQKQQAERMEGLQVGTFYSMILNILSSTKFGLLVYTFLTHFHGWNLKIIEYMNKLDLIIDKCTLTWWWMCRTQQNDVFVNLLEFSFLSE